MFDIPAGQMFSPNFGMDQKHLKTERYLIKNTIKNIVLNHCDSHHQLCGSFITYLNLTFHRFRTEFYKFLTNKQNGANIILDCAIKIIKYCYRQNGYKRIFKNDHKTVIYIFCQLNKNNLKFFFCLIKFFPSVSDTSECYQLILNMIKK